MSISTLDSNFLVGTYLPIVVIGWKSNQAVQFDNPNILQGLSGSYTKSQVCNDCDYYKDSKQCAYQFPKDTFHYDSTIISTTQTDSGNNNCTGVSPEGFPYYKDSYNCSYTCSANSWSGNIDPKKTSQLGTSNILYGDCIIRNFQDSIFKQLKLDKTQIGIEGNGWDIDYDIINPNKGSCLIRYCFFKDNSDLISLNSELFSNLKNNIGKLGISLPLNIQNYLLNVSLIYGLTTLFYDQIYQKVDQTSNPFINCDRLTDLNLYLTNFTQPYTYTSLEYKSTDFLRFPDCEQDNDNYYFIIYLSYQQILSLYDPNVPNKEVFLINLANNFLRDSEGQLSNPDFSIIDFPNTIDQIQKSLQLIISNGEYSVKMTDNQVIRPNRMVQNSIDIDKLTLQFLLSVPYKLKIKNWSVMLISYFQNYSNQFTYSDNILNGISKDTGTLPLLLDKVISKDDMIKYCPNTFTFKNGPSNFTLSSLILTSETTRECMCYTSGLSPPGIPYGDNASMCFNKYCNKEILQKFNLSENICKNPDLCQEVYYWTHTDNNPDKSRNSSELDNDKFNRLCGVINPPDTSKYNNNIIYIGILLSILNTLFIFLISKNKNYSSFKTFICCFIILIISITCTYFLSILLKGDYICKNRNLVCVSKGFNKYITIPDEFCDNSKNTNCECQIDENCGQKCTCDSGNCIPLEGERKSNIIKEYKIRYIQIILSVFISIIFPLLFIYASTDYEWHINKKLYITIIILLSLIPIIYIIVKTLIKIDKKVYDPINCI